MRDLFNGRGTTSATPNQQLSPGWAEKYFPATHQKPSEGRVSVEYRINAGREETLTAYYLAGYVQSQRPRDQSEACLQSAVSPVRESVGKPDLHLLKSGILSEPQELCLLLSWRF